MKRIWQRVWGTRGGNRLLGVLALLLPVAVALTVRQLHGSVLVFPPCFFRTLTGLHCPGCGGTRMVAALLAGDLLAALRYNPLFLLGGAALAGGLVWFILRTFRRGWQPLRLSTKSAWWLLVPAAILLFTVVRNTPWYRGWFY